MLCDYMTVVENDQMGFECATWRVYVEPGKEQEPSTYHMSRKKGKESAPGKFHSMDSPTVKKSGVRALAEKAVLSLYSGGGVMLSEKNITRAFVRIHAKKDRQPTARHERKQNPLYPIAMDHPNGEALKIDFILDQAQPVRYQIVAPNATLQDQSTWQVLLYRRLNPRAKTDFQYGMRIMPTGKGRPTDNYEDAEVAVMHQNIDRLLAIAKPGGKLFTTLSVAKLQIDRLDKTICAASEPGNGTITQRLKEQAAFIIRAYFNVKTDPSPDNVKAWTMLRDGILAQRERLEPKFSAYIASLERKNRMKASENDTGLAMHGAQTPANSFIPPMPPLHASYSQTTPKALETPATASNPGLASLTTFLNPGTTPQPHPLEPSSAVQTSPAGEYTPPTRQEVREWLTSIGAAPNDSQGYDEP